MNNNECKNNYTNEDFFYEFGKDENDMKKCNSCKYLSYSDGNLICTNFNEEKED